MKLSVYQEYIKVLDPNINLTSDLDLFLKFFNPIKINLKKINVLDTIFSVGYCYFSLQDVLEFDTPLIHVR